jgi:hypothetical protein
VARLATETNLRKENCYRRNPVTGIHGLVREAKEHFSAGQKVDEGKHLKPYKHLLVDVMASRAGLEKALAFATTYSIESKGHRVVISTSAESFTGASGRLNVPR